MKRTVKIFLTMMYAVLKFQEATAQVSSEVRAPVIIGIMQDISLSGDHNRIPFISEQQLGKLLEIIKDHSGELGFGLIADQSNRTLIRLRVDKEPVAPVRPAKERNPFFAVQQRKAYQRSRDSYNEKMVRWNKEFSQSNQRFIDSVERLMRNTKRGWTDIWGAVKRLNLFLEEDVASWDKEPLRFAVLITDGENTIRKPKVTMTPQAKVIIVNGSASAGNLAELKPLAFENIDAAIRYIQTVIRKGGSNHADSRAPTLD